MTRYKAVMSLSIAICCLIVFLSAALAEEPTLVKGMLRRIDLNNNLIVITTADKEDITFVVEDLAIIGALNRGKMTVGDMVNVKFIEREGKRIAVYLKPPAGC